MRKIVADLSATALRSGERRVLISFPTGDHMFVDLDVEAAAKLAVELVVKAESEVAEP